MPLRHFFLILVCLVVLAAMGSVARAVTVSPDEDSVHMPMISSPAIVDGHPAIAWQAGYYTVIKYARAMDAAGTVWGAPVTVDRTEDDGYQVILRTVNGHPAILYSDSRLGKLKFARANDPAGSTWGTPMVIGLGEIRPAAFAMEIVDGHPAIALTSNESLNFVRAEDASGSVWGAPVRIVPPYAGGGRPCMKIVEGRPAIAYTTEYRLLFVRAADEAGSTWEAPVDVGPYGDRHTLEVVDGHPAMTFTVQSREGDHFVSHLMYARAATATGSEWGPAIQVEDSGTTVRNSSLAVVNGKPAISYDDEFGGDRLRYVEATDSTGTAWGPPQTVDRSGYNPSLLEVGGTPLIAYHNFTRSTLDCVRAVDHGDGTRWPPDPLLEGPRGPLKSDTGEHAFGTVAVGTAAPAAFTVSNPNPGSADLIIQRFTIDGPDAAEFTVSGLPSPATLATGASMPFTVHYAPAKPGLKSAFLHIVSSAESPSDSFTIRLTGQSVPQMVLEPPPELVRWAGESQLHITGSVRNLTFTIRNTGGAELNGLAVTIYGEHAREFLIVSAPATAVAPGGRTTFTLRHIAAAPGGKFAVVSVANNSFRDPYDMVMVTEPGSWDQRFNPAVNVDSPPGAVSSLAVGANGTILAGGPERLSNFNPDGTPHLPFFAPPVTGGRVDCLAHQIDEKILMGGSFTRVEGQSRPGLARLYPNGALDREFAPALSTGVRCLAVQADGKILAGGTFGTVAGEPHPFLARLHADGSPDASFTALPNDAVRCLALQRDGKILVGGNFTAIGPATTSRLVRLHPDGTLDTNFEIPSGSPGEAFCVAVLTDGKILAGGTFPGGLARFSPDGSPLPLTGFTSAGPFFALAAQTDGQCLAAGEIADQGFSSVHLTRVKTNGTVEVRFCPHLSQLMDQVAAGSDGRILVGASAPPPPVAGGSPPLSLARIENDAAFSLLKTEGSSTIRWLRSGSSPEVSHVSFELNESGSSVWTLLGHGTHVPGGWELSGLSLPASGNIRARGLAGGSLMESVTPILTAFEYWRIRHFGTATSKGFSSATADPDQDGLTNLTEFAFGLSPVDRESSALPEFKHSGETFTASFSAPEGREDVIYGAEWSPTMLPGTWTAIPDTGAAGGHVFSIAGKGERLFLRFAVRMP